MAIFEAIKIQVVCEHVSEDEGYMKIVKTQLTAPQLKKANLYSSVRFKPGRMEPAKREGLYLGYGQLATTEAQRMTGMMFCR
ncbi:hypothetical protein CVT25_008166 [Psilocybe cyanescens]|uniref:Uncharacterized protein n=1 Tax=Psilocybe cyanescens TaxID=93625 RepID=A0A409X9N7_PSICY|nr:hypothetical protein CVT25_008166 [Psilocybe cyanescens]